MNNLDYRYVIVFFILFVTVPISIKLLYHSPGIADPVITINKKKISKAEIDKRLSIDSCENNYQSLINSIVVKEVLIQEAVKSGINKEKAFQESIRNFYEQSLIKILMDRKYSELSPKIEPELIQKYVELSDKMIQLTVITYISITDYKNNNVHTQKKTFLPFNSLSTFLRYQILQLKEGEMTKPVLSDTSTDVYKSIYTVFRLDSVEKTDDSTPRETDVEMIAELLSEKRKEALISQWMENLKSKARVEVSPTLKNNRP